MKAAAERNMALLFAVVLALITVISVALTWAKIWWFPVDISAHGQAIDQQFDLTFIFCGIIFVLAQLGLAWAIWRYRERGDGRKAVYSHGNLRLEMTWTIAAAIVFIGLNLMGYRVWSAMHFMGPEPGAMQIEVTGQQFQWYFRYPGADGEFGPLHVNRINDATGNFLGMDREKDPASRDDIMTATLGIPENRPVQLMLRSKDVTHSFFVRELRIKQDLVPGMVIPIHFVARQAGRYEIACAELCGLGHYRMRAFLQVMPEEEYRRWLKTMADQQ
jgi:cytochrome c oxidase subunit 2